MTMFEAFASYPALLMAAVFLLSLLVGSFLNVVIHRLPIMLDREWRAEAQQVLAEGVPSDSSAGPSSVFQAPEQASLSFEMPGAEVPVSPPRTYNLIVPRSACPHCG